MNNIEGIVARNNKGYGVSWKVGLYFKLELLKSLTAVVSSAARLEEEARRHCPCSMRADGSLGGQNGRKRHMNKPTSAVYLVNLADVGVHGSHLALKTSLRNAKETGIQ